MLHWNKQKTTKMEIPEKAHTMCLFSMRDKQIGTHGVLFEAPNIDEVKESLIHLFRDEKQKDNQLVKYSDKFQLYLHGTVNKKTGILTSADPEKVLELEDLKNQ